MRFSLITVAALLSGAHGDKLRHEELESLMNRESRQLKGMKKPKVNDDSRGEKQKKSTIRAESNSATKKKKKKKAAKNKLASGASYGTAEGGVETSTPKPIDKIHVGNKRAVGIARGPDDTMFVTEMLYGGIKKVDVLSGEVEQVVPSYGFRERGARGIVWEQSKLFVAGGGVPDGTPLMVYVYDAKNGEEVVACAPEGDEWYLLNDIAIHGDYAYITDTRLSKLLVVDVAAALKGECKVFSINTPDHYFLADQENYPRANGIVSYADGLLIARTEPSGIFYVDLMDEDLPFMKLAAPDEAPHGLAIDNDILYSTESAENTIGYSRLITESHSIQPLGTLEASGLDYPAAAAIYGNFLCTVNARITSLPINATAEGAIDFDEKFFMSCIDRSFDE